VLNNQGETILNTDKEATTMLARSVQGEGHALDRLGNFTGARSHFMIAAELWRTLQRWERVETCEHLADSVADENALMLRRRRAWRGLELVQ
jgi:hypothetical protein